MIGIKLEVRVSCYDYNHLIMTVAHTSYYYYYKRYIKQATVRTPGTLRLSFGTVPQLQDHWGVYLDELTVPIG